MRWLIDTFLPNFTKIRTFESDGDEITEYIYGSKRYLTDTWPPKRGIGFPIKSVIREDGTDVTHNVLKFSGPMRNFVHHLGICEITKRIRIKFINFSIRFELVDYIERYSGTVTVTDIFGNLKTIRFD